MSKVSTLPFDCPECHTHCEFERWESVNTQLNPEMKEKVMNGDMFLFRCAKCGKEVMIVYPFMYHDMEHGFMIQFEPDEPDSPRSKDFRLPKNLEALVAKNYRFRTVHSLLELAEKIFILERGLDDVAVERMKYMIRNVSLPKLKDKRLRVHRITDKEPDFKYGKIYFTYQTEQENEPNVVWFDMESYYEHECACKYDPRMKMETDVLLTVDESLMDSLLRKV